MNILETINTLNSITEGTNNQEYDFKDKMVMSSSFDFGTAIKVEPTKLPDERFHAAFDKLFIDQFGQSYKDLGTATGLLKSASTYKYVKDMADELEKTGDRDKSFAGKALIKFGVMQWKENRTPISNENAKFELLKDPLKRAIDSKMQEIANEAIIRLDKNTCEKAKNLYQEIVKLQRADTVYGKIEGSAIKDFSTELYYWSPYIELQKRASSPLQSAKNNLPDPSLAVEDLFHLTIGGIYAHDKFNITFNFKYKHDFFIDVHVPGARYSSNCTNNGISLKYMCDNINEEEYRSKDVDELKSVLLTKLPSASKVSLDLLKAIDKEIADMQNFYDAALKNVAEKEEQAKKERVPYELGKKIRAYQKETGKLPSNLNDAVRKIIIDARAAVQETARSGADSTDGSAYLAPLMKQKEKLTPLCKLLSQFDGSYCVNDKVIISYTYTGDILDTAEKESFETKIDKIYDSGINDKNYLI